MVRLYELCFLIAVSLTKTDRKGLAWKQRIIDDIRFCVEKYPNIFVFQVQNMRNNLLKDLRQEWKKNSRFIFGKNRIMQIGLGRTKAEEVETDLHKVCVQEVIYNYIYWYNIQYCYTP